MNIAADADSMPLTPKAKEKPQFSWKAMALVCVGLAAFYTVPAFFIDRSGLATGERLFFIVGGGLSGVIYYSLYFLAKRWLHGVVVRQVDSRSIQQSAERLQDDLEKDFFTNLVKINFKYLDKYYLQTQLQAEKSFILSGVAAVAGLAIVISGIVLMYLDRTNPAVLASAAGVITEFIAAVFFYLYNGTVLKMSEYHQKLVFTQNIALALRISEGLPESQKVGSHLKLIDSLTDGINNYLLGRPAADSRDARSQVLPFSNGKIASSSNAGSQKQQGDDAVPAGS